VHSELIGSISWAANTGAGAILAVGIAIAAARDGRGFFSKWYEEDKGTRTGFIAASRNERDFRIWITGGFLFAAVILIVATISSL